MTDITNDATYNATNNATSNAKEYVNQYVSEFIGDGENSIFEYDEASGILYIWPVGSRGN